jgi:hypothetical protein
LAVWPLIRIVANAARCFFRVAIAAEHHHEDQQDRDDDHQSANGHEDRASESTGGNHW